MGIIDTIDSVASNFSKDFKVLNEIILSKDSFLHNISVLKRISGLDIAPVLKANAYGHGIEAIATMSQNGSVPFIVVDGYFEALQIRKSVKTPVLVLSAIDEDNFENLKLDDFAFTVSRLETIHAIGKTGKTAKIHIEVETGMKRHGITKNKLPKLIKTLEEYDNITVEGIMSHLADADNPKSEEFVDKQIERFDKAVEQIKQAGHDPKWIHISQSAGSTRKMSKYANVVRPGIALYGINPLDPKDPKYEELQQTRPVMSITSKIGAVQELKAGESLSYGLTYTTENDQKIAVIPFGYYEGLPSVLSNKAVLLGPSGEELLARGRICMNHTMLDITDTDLKTGDAVTVISSNRSDPNSIQSICDKFDLFNYEFLVKISSSTRTHIIQ